MRPRLGHAMIGVGGGQNAGCRRQSLARHGPVVAGAVHPLVMLGCQGSEAPERLETGQNAVCVVGVQADLLPLREEVYLQLTLETYAEWNTVVAQQFAGGPMTPVQVANVLADTLAERPLLCDLFARVSSTLEHNISPQLGRAFKLRMLDQTHQLAAMIAAAVIVPLGQAFEMVTGGSALVAGLWPMSNPPADLAAVLEGPELQPTRASFHATLRRMLEALIVGVIHTGSPPATLPLTCTAPPQGD